MAELMCNSGGIPGVFFSYVSTFYRVLEARQY